jgi:DNA invertase Pin-like site-specific DNA recombinase
MYISPELKKRAMEQTILYSRVSTLDQDYQSQFDDLRKWANSNNFKVIKTFGEKVSGYDLTKERAEYDKMKAYVLENNIKHICCWEISRLGRSTVKTLSEIEFFTNHGVNIFFKKENLNTLSDNATNKLILTILSSMAEMERDTIIERSIRGKISSAEQGKRTGFPIMPYGFQDVEGYIQIEETEAEIIRDIYERAARGEAIRGICNHLNSLGVPTRQGLRNKKRTLRTGEQVTIQWRPVSLRKILKSPLYKGERPYRNQMVIKIPQIVDEHLWNEVQSRFEKNLGYYKAERVHDYLSEG